MTCQLQHRNVLVNFARLTAFRNQACDQWGLPRGRKITVHILMPYLANLELGSDN